MGLLTRSSRLADPTQYPDVKPGDIEYVEIFPPIGVARLGDSTKEYFLGPELPIHNDGRANLLPTKDNKIRDADGNIRRQAVRFRVYAYNNQDKILGEINLKNGYTLDWKVHVVNMKAAGYNIRAPLGEKRNKQIQGDLEPHKRTKLIVDPGEKTIIRTDGNDITELNGTFGGTFQPPKDVNLGQLQVDDAGRLVFIAAKGGVLGKAPQSINLDSDDCVDDVCDGWVDVTIKYDGISKKARHKAAVISGPPKFSWDIRSTTSILDLIENMYLSIKDPEFNVDIWPVLEAASLMSWVDARAYSGHGPRKPGDFASRHEELQLKTEQSQAAKQKIFRRLKNPNGGGGNMPRLEGPDTAITKLQYARFERWKDLKFDVIPIKQFQHLEDLDLTEQPRYLTRANLEATIGSSFHPGIEACSKVGEEDTYLKQSTALDPPYRVDFSETKIRPGDLTEGLAVPWQADFDRCTEAWWPAARPTKVYVNDPSGPPVTKAWARGAENTKILEHWKDLGFIRRPIISEEIRIESERELPGFEEA